VKFWVELAMSLAPRQVSASAFQAGDPASSIAAATAKIMARFCIAFLVDGLVAPLETV
jgi:hypothetical protein